jgi:putative ABC transport system ATP-binding protein
MTPLLQLRGVHKSFARTTALRGVSLDVAAGEVVAVTGPSGSGKSTLLHCATGVLRPEAGDVTFDGRRLDEMNEAERTRLRRREIGLVLQFGQLVPELTALQNAALPLILDGRDRAVARTAAMAWLERLGIEHVAAHVPAELAGGESQRVALARALITAPRLVCADEPTGALDTVAGETVLSELLASVRETGASLMVVTHDNRVAARADREVVLHDGAVAAGQPAASS